MLNVVIAGIGGQGSVLASKILATAAANKGWCVRTAETIGMAQRGGSVVSHVRMGDCGEQPLSPLIPLGAADVIIALEPGEAVRALPYLGPAGLLVTATTAIPSTVSNLAGDDYRAQPLLSYLAQQASYFVTVDEEAVCAQVGSRKVANIALLAAAVHFGQEPTWGLRGAISQEDFEEALRACVKPQFIDMNLAAVVATINQLQADACK